MNNKQKCLKTVSVLNSHKFFKNRFKQICFTTVSNIISKTVSNMFETRFKHVSKPFQNRLKHV